MIELAACADLDPATGRGPVDERRLPGGPGRCPAGRPDDRDRPQPDAAGRPRRGVVGRDRVPASTSTRRNRWRRAAGTLRTILAEAAAAGVRVGAAPDTFLGAGLQTARALVDDGAIGTPLGASASVAHLGPERWHPNPSIFYAAGGGPLLDVGPYYVAALVEPARSDRAGVAAVGRGVGGERSIGHGPSTGATLDVRRCPTTVIGTLEFASGAIGGLTRLVRRRREPGAAHRGPRHERVAEPRRPERRSTATVRLRRIGGEAWKDIPLRSTGRSAAASAWPTWSTRSARIGRSRAAGAFAFHVLEVLLATRAAPLLGRRTVAIEQPDGPPPKPCPRAAQPAIVRSVSSRRSMSSSVER